MKRINGLSYADAVNKQIKKAYRQGNEARFNYYVENRVWRHKLYLQLRWLKEAMGIVLNKNDKFPKKGAK